MRPEPDFSLSWVNDRHVKAAAAMFSVRPWEVTEEMRQRAKTALFAGAYKTSEATIKHLTRPKRRTWLQRLFAWLR